MTKVRKITTRILGENSEVLNQHYLMGGQQPKELQLQMNSYVI